MPHQQVLSVWVVDTVADSAIGASGGSAVAVVRVCGEVDMSTAPLLAETLDRILSATPDRPVRPLVVDCSAMTFCSARGLDVLYAADHRAARLAVGYAITGMSVQLARIGTAVWPAPAPARYPTTDEAVRAVRGARPSCAPGRDDIDDREFGSDPPQICR